ncbi:MAG: transcriptional repressor [Limnochordales bacterium]|nr:transcriptional repressor [Limnochordales bacterium]
MTDWVEKVRQVIAARDQRLTPQRQLVLQVLAREGDSHLSAEEIYLLARREMPEIGLATVYRTLELFAELGVISRLEVGAGQARYELNRQPDLHYHHHLICRKCGRIEEFREDLLEELERRVEEETGFSITDHNLRFFGLCRSCRTNGSA